MNFIRKYSEALNAVFYSCAETFLRNYGCTPDNAHEFSMEYSTESMSTAFILHNSKRVGRIEIFSSVNETGIVFTTVAKAYQEFQ
jgi:hypothetical protein